MDAIQRYDHFHELPFGVGDVCRVTWAQNEQELSRTVAGYIVGRDCDSSHIYISINPAHITEACWGRITDARRKELGIEKIAAQEIRAITQLRDYDETSFVPHREITPKHAEDVEPWANTADGD